MRLAILAACYDTFYVLIDGLHFEPRCVDEFSKRRAGLALRQPAVQKLRCSFVQMLLIASRLRRAARLARKRKQLKPCLFLQR